MRAPADDRSARDSFIYRLNYRTRRIKETALLYRCARIVSGPRSVPCLRRHTEGPPGARGARGPGSVRAAGAFAAEHLARWALLAGSRRPRPARRPSPILLPSLSRARSLARSRGWRSLSLSRSRVIYRAADSISLHPCPTPPSRYHISIVFSNNISPSISCKNKAQGRHEVCWFIYIRRG